MLLHTMGECIWFYFSMEIIFLKETNISSPNTPIFVLTFRPYSQFWDLNEDAI